jgi:DNA-binding NtrC family response regulator
MVGNSSPPEAPTALDQARGEPVGGVLFVLRVTEGPDAGLSTVFDGVSEGRILLGQSAVCTVRLTDRSVSRRHAALRRTREAWRLEDLESTNGTRVNGLRIKEAFLSGGELVTLGNTSFRLTRAGAAPKGVPSEANRFGRFVGASDEVCRHYAHWASLAAATMPILIEGETGTGKELLAEVLHDAGPRASRPFVVLDCSGRSADELEAALLGTETNGVVNPGVFEQANGGTLVIDEPSELGPNAQARLGAILERGELVRLLGSTRVKVDVRVVTTTRRDLDHEVQAGRFREDLLYRIAGASIEVPPLRQRKGDISVLAKHLWTQLGGAGEPSPELLATFEDNAWPGNVRELAHAIAERLATGTEALVGVQSASVASSTAPPVPQESAPSDNTVTRILAMNLPYIRARQEMLREFEARYVSSQLEQQGGNVSKAAAASGLARRYFQILKSRGR